LRSFTDLGALVGRVPAHVVTRLSTIDFGRDQTIRLVLEQLKNEGKVRADGTGRAATWTRMTNTAAH